MNYFVFCAVLRMKAVISVKTVTVGVFAKLQKATVSFVMSVRPSDPIVHLGSHCRDFHEI
jgi:hypothetical protein